LLRCRSPLLALSCPNLPCALKAAIGFGKRTLGDPASLPRRGAAARPITVREPTHGQNRGAPIASMAARTRRWRRSGRCRNGRLGPVIAAPCLRGRARRAARPYLGATIATLAFCILCRSSVPPRPSAQDLGAGTGSGPRLGQDGTRRNRRLRTRTRPRSCLGVRGRAVLRTQPHTGCTRPSDSMPKRGCSSLSSRCGLGGSHGSAFLFLRRPRAVIRFPGDAKLVQRKHRRHMRVCGHPLELADHHLLGPKRSRIRQ